MDLLKTITELSHEFGTDEYVRGGGGNTSCKDDRTLHVKPSGTTLAGLTPEKFVAMDRATLVRLYAAQTPADPAARETLVKDMMAAAVRPTTPGRASVEAPLHDSFRARFVVHTHPAIVNGLTCAKDGRRRALELFPEALWIPYTDPGYTLCMRVRKDIETYRQAHGREPGLLLLENHGIFVAGDTPEEIRAIYGRVMSTLRRCYQETGTAMILPVGPAPAAADVTAVRAALVDGLGAEAAAVVSTGLFDVAAGPVSPDHIVYSKSYPFEGECTPAALQTFRRTRGYAPRIVRTGRAVYGVGANEKTAALALELAQDGALVKQLAGCFGGLQWMSDDARRFIENWEVESYRAKQMS